MPAITPEVTAATAADADRFPSEGRARAVIENIAPAIDHGRFAIKRVADEEVTVEADCFTDGHDQIACLLLWRRGDEREWHAVRMQPLGNDRWRAAFTVQDPGSYRYTVTAWVDPFLSWRHDFARRVDAEDVRIAAHVGAELIESAAQRARTAGAPANDAARLARWASELRDAQTPEEIRTIGLNEAMSIVAQRHPDRSLATTYPVEFAVTVDRVRARFSTWYELFPRSASDDVARHGTFRDLEARLPYIAAMGFDVLYMPPIHPIGRERRKGRNNTLLAHPGDVGSPWAIGAAEGGHTAVHPALGTLADLRHLVEAARAHGMELALDIAFQTAPDHPYVKQHPAWFKRRPDGSVQYAENPPKKYQDIYPFNFESDDWQALWRELAHVFEFWIGEGIEVFRVDNPHTKSFPFWEWTIARIKEKHPGVIFLAEAFTRPKVMHRLAKLGYTQSYTYFTWRNTKKELTEYFTELTSYPGREYFRPNAWPNTPDILPESLQFGGRPAFMARLVLAATLSASYGIYGPAFELMEHVPREPGGEEYLNSEKYELKAWDIDRPDSLSEFIGRVNRIRRENTALQSNLTLRFMAVDNDQLICYAKTDPEPGPDGDLNVIVVVVNLDYHHRQSGWVELDLAALGVEPRGTYQMHELLTDARYLWTGARNYVALDPSRAPAHIFRLRRRARTESDFDYFM